jgi:hypothetical protein
MSVLSTVTKLLQASNQSTHRGDGTEAPDGAYWCDDCDQRSPDTDVEGDRTPDCPDCGESMAFERSPGTTGCAC